MKQHPTDADVLNYKETNSDMLKKKPSSEEDQQIKLFEHRKKFPVMINVTGIDALSVGLGKISYLLDKLSETRFLSQFQEIERLVSEYGFEAERHLYRNLLIRLDLPSVEENILKKKYVHDLYLKFWLEKLPMIIRASTFKTFICDAFDLIFSEEVLMKVTHSAATLLSSISMLFKLNFTQKLIFTFALQNSNIIQMKSLATEYLSQCLVDFIETIRLNDGFQISGLSQISTDILHSLLLSIRNSNLISHNDFQLILTVVRSEFPKESIINKSSVILLPMLYQSDTALIDSRTISNHSDSTAVFDLNRDIHQMLVDCIRELGYAFTSSPEFCRNILNYFGLENLKISMIAQIITMMVQTHTGLKADGHIYDKDGVDLVQMNEENFPTTWKLGVFIQTVNDLFPGINWKDVILEFDHPAFFIRDRQAFTLLTAVVTQCISGQTCIEIVCGRWKNIEGQFSWLFYGIKYPDIFCFGDYPIQSVLIDDIRIPSENRKELITWRSLSLIECLLRLADAGLHRVVQKIFKHSITYAFEFIFIGLLQIQNIHSQLKQELLSILVGIILTRSLYSTIILSAMWNSQYKTTTHRKLLLSSLVECYQHSNHDEQEQHRILSQILDLIHEIQYLPSLLNAQPIVFIIDLACLSHQRGYLNLDKWLLDKLSEYKEPFLEIVTEYLSRKAQTMFSLNSMLPSTVNTMNNSNSDPMHVLVNFLRNSLTGKPSNETIDMSDSISFNGRNPAVGFTNDEPKLARAGSMPTLFNSQNIYHRSNSLAASLNASTSQSMGTTTIRSTGVTDQSVISPAISTMNMSSNSMVNDSVDVNIYFNRLYSNSSNAYALSVDDFLDLMTRFKDSPHQRDKDTLQKIIQALFEESKFYHQYPEHELYITAQFFGGLIDRGLLTAQMLLTAFRILLESLKTLNGNNLWKFGLATLDRCKTRVRENPTLVKALQNLPTYAEIPISLREYIEQSSNPVMESQFPFSRSLSTPNAALMMGSQSPITHSPITNNPFLSMNNGPVSMMHPSISHTPSYITSTLNGNSTVRDNSVQKGPSLNQSANITTLTSDPSYHLVRVEPPPDDISEKIGYILNSMTPSNLLLKGKEMKELIADKSLFWKWLAQSLVLKCASIDSKHQSLYATLMTSLNVNILYQTALSETHRNIKILLLSDKKMDSIPDRALLKNLGHLLGLITIAINKPILSIDLDIKSLIIEAHHLGSQTLLYVIPFVAKILESCARSKIFQQPNPWLMGIMSVLAEMHSSVNFKLNLRFEIEVLCRNLQIRLTDLPINNLLNNKEYFSKLEKQLVDNNRQIPVNNGSTHHLQRNDSSPVYNDSSLMKYEHLSVSQPNLNRLSPLQQRTPSTNGPLNTSVNYSTSPKYKLGDFKSSLFQSLSSMLVINPNILLFQHHPRLKTYIHPPIEQAINDAFQTIQKYLKISADAAETMVRKDFLLNPDEQQLRTSARNMVAYLISGLVLTTARAPLQESIQSHIRNHLQTVLGIPQMTNGNENLDASQNSTEQTTNHGNIVNGAANDLTSSQTRDMVQQAAVEIAASNIELCCCLLQRTAIHKAIQLIDQRLVSDMEIRHRCRAEGQQLPDAEKTIEFQNERLIESIRLRYGPLSAHQLAIYEDFVHFIPGFKPNGNEKRENLTSEENATSVWDRVTADIEQTIQIQRNLLFSNALRRLMETVNRLRITTQHQLSNTHPEAALNSVLNTVVYNLFECYTQQAQNQDPENLDRFKNVHMNVLKLLVEIRLQMTHIVKQLTRAWLECSPEIKFNVFALNQLLRDRLLDIREVDTHIACLIDSGSAVALYFAENFLRSCLIEHWFCNDTEVAAILESLHRLSLIGKQPTDTFLDLLETIRLNYISLSGNGNLNNSMTNLNDSNSSITTNTNNSQTSGKVDRLATISLSVINSGNKYLNTSDDNEGMIISTKAAQFLGDWIARTMNHTSRVAQQHLFQVVSNQMNNEGLFRSDDTVSKFLRATIQLCVNNAYDIIRQAPPISSSNSSAFEQGNYVRCHQVIDSFCRFLSLVATQTSETNNMPPRILLLNRILGILAAQCFLDHEEQGEQFHPLVYQRIILNLFQETTSSLTWTFSNSSNNVDIPLANEQLTYYIYLAFTNCLHLLRPQRVPGFAFAWLEIVVHRTFISRLLMSSGRYVRLIHQMYATLLVDGIRLVVPYIRSGDLPQSMQVYFKGILKTFILLLHDFPEFLCEHFYQLCDAIPLMACQLRNIVLSASPKNIRCPDPNVVNYKVDILSDISTTPIISYNYVQNIQPSKFKMNLDSYLRTRAPVTFLSELRSYLQQGADPGSRYNSRMMTALVLYVATQALATLNNRANGQPLLSSITHSAHMDIFQNLAVDLDTEGRYIFLNAMANHLRYPNAHTHYFSYTINYLFAEANSEALQEQIFRVLLERLISQSPHPWGLSVTFFELVRSPNSKLWSREFMTVIPDIKRLLATIIHGFPNIPPQPTNIQQPQQQQQQPGVVKP